MPPTTIATATAAQLAAGRWTTIPAAPLEARVAVSVVWAGDELVVWGGRGEPSGRLENDGAAYNRATRTWRKLPPSPLTPRTGALALWTGTDVVFWGGIQVLRPRVPHPPSVAAAAYRPSTDTWRSLGSAPLTPTHTPLGAWTGDRVVLFSGLDAASYDPATNKWLLLPSALAPPRLRGWRVYPRGWQFAVANGPGRFLASAGWYATGTGAQAHTGYEREPAARSGSELLQYDEVANHWTRVLSGPPGYVPIEAFKLDHRLVVLGATESFGPTGGNYATASYDLLARTTRLVSPDGFGQLPGFSAWSGAALFTCSKCDAIENSSTAVYDPTTSASRMLPHPPLGRWGSYFYPTSTPVWTGTSVLVFGYGQLYVPSGRRSVIAGFEWTPA